MSARVQRFFLDTNIFVYTFDETAPVRMAQARELVEMALTTGMGAVSFQVIQEFLNVATGKFAVPLDPADCRLYLDSVLSPMCRVWPSVALYLRALEVREETGFGFYDSLIVTAALADGCQTLYTQDLQSGRRIGPLSILDPFTV